MTEDTYRDKLNSLQLEIEELRAKLKEAQTGDTISRQAAIDAIVAWTVEDRSDVEMPTDLIDRIKALPSAQPEKRTEKRTKTHACD